MVRAVRTAASLLLLAAAWAVGAAGEGLRVEATVNRKSLRVGESLVLTLRLQGPGSAVPQPPLPPLADFKLTGQYQTVEGAGADRAFAYHYMLSPTRAGRLTVPELSLRIGGETRTVPGFAVDVETAPVSAAPPSLQESLSPPVEAGGDLQMVGELSSPRAYLGQPVTYTLHLVTRLSVRNFEITKRPDFQGFRKVEVPQPGRPPTRQSVRGGVTFLDVTILRFTLFPIEDGTLRITPFDALLRVESREVIGKVLTVKLTGGAANLTTEALPSPPPGFSGAVGSFSLALAGSAPSSARLGQPFDLDYRVEGTGFLPDNPLRWAETPFFTVYPATARDESAFGEGAFRVRRSVRLSLLPRLAGDAALPKAALVFFDPSARAYRTQETGGGRVEIRGTGAAGEASLSLAPLVENPRPSPRRGDPTPGPGFLVLLLAPFALSGLLAVGLQIYRTRFAAPEKLRERALVHEAHHQLHQARRHLDVRHSEACHGFLLRALHAGFDLKTGRATAGMPRPALREVLRDAGMTEEEIGRWMTELDGMEAAEFAGEPATKRDLQARHDAVRRFLEEVRRG